MDATYMPAGFVRCTTPDGRFADMVGPLYVCRDEGGTSYGFRVEARHGNVRGAMHGGMMMTLADQVLGLTVVDAVRDAPVVTVSLNTDFVAAAFPGDWLVGRAEIVRKARSLVFVRGTLCRDDEIVLNAVGIWKQVRRERANAHLRIPREKQT